MEEQNGFKKFLLSKLGKALIIIILYCIFFGITYAVISATSNSGDWVTFAVLVFFGIFGWKALNKITPAIFLTMPIVGWLIYFIIKGLLSVLIGIFVAPFVISKAITNALIK